MNLKNVVEYIEDKDIVGDSNWYLHTTFDDVDIIRKILTEGIKCSHLLGLQYPSWNGPYYISMFKNDETSSNLQEFFIPSVKFIIAGIRAYRCRNTRFAKSFTDTKIPIRASIHPGEYQSYFFVDPSKFVGIDYCLSRILPTLNAQKQEKQLCFLRDVVECIQQARPQLPIYDLSSQKELNKDKILSLRI